MNVNDEIINEIKQKADIVDVISEYISLRRSGSNFKALCPFHDDRNPSLMVSPSKQIYKCFVCGAGGNVITFVRDYAKVSFNDAIKIVADKYGIKINYYQSDDSKKKENRFDLIHKVLEYSEEYYHKLLFTPEGKIAYDYLKGRGFSDSIIEKFKLGYAPDSWDRGLNEFKRLNFNIEIIKAAKLALTKENSDYTFDTFRGRLMFPIKDIMGRTIAYGARKLLDTDKAGKYINSPDSEVYNKSKTLFGLSEAKREITLKKEVIIVEGYADLLTMVQYGFNNVVAPCGTAFTTEQAQILKRLCDNIIFMFDGDKAGQLAARRSIEIALTYNLNMKIVTLPEGEDPDTLLKNRGKDALLRYISNSDNFIDFILKTEKLKIAEPQGKAIVAREILQLINIIPDKFTHDDYIQRLAGLLSLSIGQLKQLYDEKSRLIEKNNAGMQTNQNPSKYINTPYKSILPNTKSNVTIVNSNHQIFSEAAQQITESELAVLKLLLIHNDPLSLIESKYDIHVEYFHTELGQNLFSIIYEYAYDRKNILEEILFDEEIGDFYINLLLSIAMPTEEFSSDWALRDELVIDFDLNLHQAINKIFRDKLIQRRTEISKKLKHNPNENEKFHLVRRLVSIDKKLQENDLLAFKEMIFSEEPEI